MHIERRVLDRLAAETRFSDVRLLSQTASTNRDALDLAEAGAPEGLVVCADWQSAGRGRLDRTWEAAPGDGLLASVLLRPDLPLERWHLATAACAVAARGACLDVAGVAVELKWPNDLLAGEAKLAGILAESSGGALVIGMGLNVHAGPPGAAWLDALAGRRISRAALLLSWLRRLDALLGDFKAVTTAYRPACSTIGRDVSVECTDGSVITGRAEDVDDAGRLVVVDAGHRRQVISVGDVTHLRSRA